MGRTAGSSCVAWGLVFGGVSGLLWRSAQGSGLMGFPPWRQLSYFALGLLPQWKNCAVNQAVIDHIPRAARVQRWFLGLTKNSLSNKTDRLRCPIRKSWVCTGTTRLCAGGPELHCAIRTTETNLSVCYKVGVRSEHPNGPPNAHRNPFSTQMTAHQ